MIKRKLLTIVFAAVSTGAGARAATVFNFDTDPLGASTSFTDASGGISATFTSSADPGGFVIYPTMFETLTGNVLGDPGPAGVDGLSLNVAFNQNLSALTLNFATADFNIASPFTLAAYEDATLVGSTTSTGMFLNGFLFPEGEIAFQAAAFNKIVLSSTAMDFAVDNITVAANTVPEPATCASLSVGLLGMGMTLARRKR